MTVIKVGGIVLLVADPAIHGGGFHLEMPSYHGEPLPANPFDVVATATAQPVLMIGNNYLSRIPL
jgi:hypothetical protein